MNHLAEFHFIRPYWLLSLLPYLIILIVALKNKLQQGNWTAICDEELLPYLLQQKEVKTSRFSLTAAAIAALLCIVALAGPTWERLPSPVYKNQSAVVIALDISSTMDAEDIKPSRLIRARYKIADILKRRKDGQTALIVYAGDAFTVTPLTDDTNTIDSQLEALDTRLLAFSPGRNTSLALKRAMELLRRAGALTGHIILVTDGANVDETLPAVKALENYRLSILGVGSQDGAPIALKDGGFLKDTQGNIVIPKMSFDELESITKAGNGVYQTITTNDSDIETLLATIDQSNKQGAENNNMLFDQWDEKGPWALLLALPFAALVFRKGLICFALLVLLPLPKNSYAFEWNDLWLNESQRAYKAYEKQQFEQAAELFGDNTADSAYNTGNALAKQGKYEEAIKSYEKALQIAPNHSDAKFNKALVEKELEKQKQQQQENKDQKKDEQKDQSKEDSEQKDDKNGEKSESQDGQKKDQQSEDSSDQQKQQETDSEKQQDQQSEESSDQQKQQEKDSEKQQDQQSEKPSEQQQSSEQQEQEKKAEEEKQDAEQAKSTEQKQEEQDKSKQSPAQVEEKPVNEAEQANQQWLKRIPDDPAGLLRRKFEYQYKYEYQRKGNRQGDN